MNKKLLYILMVSVTCFISCIQSELEEIDVAGNGEGYLAMSLLASPMPGLRSLTDTEINAWENRVSEIWMLLYNESEKLEYKFVWKVQNYADNKPTELINFFDNGSEDVVVTGKSDKVSFTSLAQKINRKPYKMAVLANPSQSLFSSISIGSNLSLLETAIGDNQQNLDIKNFGSYADEQSASTPFFMSNANGLISISKIALKSTQQEAEENPVKIYLDRLLAKVTVKEKQGGVNIITPDVVLDENRPLKWYMDVVSRKTFPIRRFALLADGQTMENESNSSVSIRNRIYAEDPTYTTADNNETFFTKWTTGVTPPYSTWKSDNRQDPLLRTYQYTFENTMDLSTQSSDKWSKYATSIISEIYLIYKKLLTNPNNLNDENDPGRNYYSCLLVKADKSTEWMVFTHEQANYWLQTGFPTSSNVNTAELLKLLEEKIKEVQQDFTGGNSNAFNFRSSTSPGTDPGSFHSYKGITYHPLGLNKYCSPIRHFPAGTSTNPRKEVHGYYGVVRNNHYTLTINSISGPGTGIYDWDNRFISTQINITPWYRRNFQEEDLE